MEPTDPPSPPPARLPWDFHPALTEERLRLCARLLANARRDALAIAQDCRQRVIDRVGLGVQSQDEVVNFSHEGNVSGKHTQRQLGLWCGCSPAGSGARATTLCRPSPLISAWRCRWKASTPRPERGGGHEHDPGTRRAYAGDWRHFTAWCLQAGFASFPAIPATIAAYLAAYAETHALATLRRRLAAIARAHREARHAFDSRALAIRNALRGIAREHARPTEPTQLSISHA